MALDQNLEVYCKHWAWELETVLIKGLLHASLPLKIFLASVTYDDMTQLALTLGSGSDGSCQLSGTNLLMIKGLTLFEQFGLLHEELQALVVPPQTQYRQVPE